MSAFMLATVCALAQNQVRGVVSDKAEGTLLKGANVRLEAKGRNYGVQTSTEGIFTIDGVSMGTYTLTVSFVGFETFRQQVQVDGNLNLTVRMTEGSQGLEEVIITATRADERTPVSKTDINAEKIEAIYSGQDPSVVLEKLAPSIVSYSDAGADIGNYVQFRLRGIDQTRINTTLNGVPLNDMIDQGVFFSNFSDFGNSVESIQVQRGVGTSSNGVASYAGSINFESKRLNTEEPSGELQLLNGSFGTMRASGEISTGKLSNDLAFYSRFTRTTSDGYKENSGSDSYSFFLSGGYIGNKDILRVTAFMGKTENDQSYLPVLLSDINLNPRTNYNHPNDTDNFEQELVQVQYGRVLNSELNLNTTLYYGGSRGVFPFGLDNTTQLMFGLENDHFGLLSDIQYERGDLNLTAGLHTYTFQRDNFNYTSPNVTNPDYEDETEKNEFSFFTKASYDVGDFTVYGDLQLRSVQLEFLTDQVLSFGGNVPQGTFGQTRDWFFFNPKVGVSYRAGSNATVYASFGRTGREPTRTDILQGDGSSINEFNYTSVLDESVVQEEYVNNLEVGYQLTEERFSLAVNYFLMDFENEISLVGALAARSYVALRQNIRDSRRSGVEVQAELKPDAHWVFGLNATYMNTNVDQFDNGTEVFNDVNHIFALEILLTPSVTWNSRNGLSLNLNGRYAGESFMELSNDPEFELPSYFVLNAQANVRVSSVISLSLFVNNIFDELYFTDGAPVDLDFDGVVEGPGFRVQPPRNYYLMLKFNF